MSSGRPVQTNEFREAMAPLVRSVRSFTDAVDAIGDRHGNIATAESPAMREIADEDRYVTADDWDGPIRDVHSLGSMTLKAATDYVRTFAETFSAERPPVYGHLVIARSALESSVIAWWLNEPGIARDDRVKRGLSEYLYSAVEEQRLGLGDDTYEQAKGWIERAAALGWAVNSRDGTKWTHKSRGRPNIDGVARPSIANTITQLLVTDEAARIGNLQWSRLSAVAHVTWFGLRWALNIEETAPAMSPSMATVSYGTDSQQVAMQALCILRALRQAATARATLMGWDDAPWRADASAGARNEAAIIAAFSKATIATHDAERSS